MAPIDLRALLWGHNTKFRSVSMISPLTLTALSVWYRQRDSHALSTDPGPSTPLFDNLLLPGSSASTLFGSYEKNSWPTARVFVDITSGSFRAQMGCHPHLTTWLTGLSSMQCCKSLHLSGQIHRPLTDFKEMCGLSQVPRHQLSMIYKEILSHTHEALPTYTRKWSEDLGIEISRSDWHTSCIFTHKTSISSFIQEKNYKLLSLWYRLRSYPSFRAQLNPRKGTFSGSLWQWCDTS